MNMADPRQKTNELRLACFSLEGQNYAVDIMKIRQIIRPAKIRPLPQTPDFIEEIGRAHV